MRERLNVHHHRHLHFSGDVVDAPHLGRIQCHIELHLSDADRSSLQRVVKDLVRAGHGGIGSNGPRKPAWATFHFLFCPVLIGCGSQQDRVRDAAALHMRKARARILPQVQVGIKHRTTPVRCGLCLYARRYQASRQQ